MARLTLNVNLAGDRGLRSLKDATESLDASFEKLSTGLRIAKPSEDSAGLAIAKLLDTDHTIFTQGTRNINDGISMLTIADGALQEMGNILIRLEELAEQAANAALNQNQRVAIDKEGQALKREYSRIIRTTDYNGMELFTGDADAVSVLAGYGEESLINAVLGGNIGDGTFRTADTNLFGNFPHYLASGDFDNDGNKDLITNVNGTSLVQTMLGNGDGTFQVMSGSNTGADAFKLDVEDFNGDGILDVVSASDGNNNIGVAFGDGDGTFTFSATYTSDGGNVAAADLNGDGHADIVAGGGTNSTSYIFLNNGDGTFESGLTHDNGASSHTSDVKLADVSGDGIVDLITTVGFAGNGITVSLGTGQGSFHEAVTYSGSIQAGDIEIADLNYDGALDIATVGYNGSSINVHLNNGDGTFQAQASYSVSTFGVQISSGDFNGDSYIDLVASNDGAGNNMVIRLGSEDGTFDEAITLDDNYRWVHADDFNNDGVTDIFATDGMNGINFQTNTTDGAAILADFDLTSRYGAIDALREFGKARDRIGLQRGTIAAAQSRMESVFNTLQFASENSKVAGGRIKDVDIAAESANVTNQRILQQASTAVLVNSDSLMNTAFGLVRETTSSNEIPGSDVL